MQYCKKVYDYLKRPDLSNKYLATFPAIMHLDLDSTHYAFFNYRLDRALLWYFIFVNSFEDFRKYKPHSPEFLRRMSVSGIDYFSYYKTITNKQDQIFPPGEIERY